jgi:hypothetical protein
MSKSLMNTVGAIVSCAVLAYAAWGPLDGPGGMGSKVAEARQARARHTARRRTHRGAYPTRLFIVNATVVAEQQLDRLKQGTAKPETVKDVQNRLKYVLANIKSAARQLPANPHGHHVQCYECPSYLNTCLQTHTSTYCSDPRNVESYPYCIAHCPF